MENIIFKEIKYRAAKQLKDLLKRHLIIIDRSKIIDGLIQFEESFNPAELTDNHRRQLDQIYPGCLILNDLDINIALQKYETAQAGIQLKHQAAYNQVN